MTNEPAGKSSWGKGRIAFVARLDTIRTELGEGMTLTAIYDRHKAALQIGYSAFIKLVARHAPEAKPLKRRSAMTAAGPPSSAQIAPTRPVPPKTEASTHARHEPACRPDFKHHGIVQEGEPEQLFGPGFLPKRRA